MMTRTEWINKARTYHGSRYDYSQIVFRGMSKKVKLVCPKHGPWWTMPSQHATPSAHHGCRQCRYRIPDEEWLRRFKERHGDQYDYSRCDFQHGDKPVEIICKKHGPFHATPQHHGRAGKSGRCPDCRRLDVRVRFLERSKAAHGDRYDYSLVDFESINDKVRIICKERGPFWQTPHNHQHGHNGCRKCSDHGSPRSSESVMTKPYEVHIPPAQSMRPLRENKWFAGAQVMRTGTGRENDLIKLYGEWHGKTSGEAEAKARRAAEEWIARHTEL